MITFAKRNLAKSKRGNIVMFSVRHASNMIENIKLNKT